MKVVLIGFACSYKTSAGKIVAEKLNYVRVDTDSLAEKLAGKSIADIFTADGENVFRAIEADALRSVSSLDNAVISCGGGSVLIDAFGQFAKTSTVVWLKVNAQSVKQRLGGAARPLFDGKTAEQLNELINAREAYYKKYADLIIDTNGLTSEQVAEEIIRKLNYK